MGWASRLNPNKPKPGQRLDKMLRMSGAANKRFQRAVQDVNLLPSETASRECKQRDEDRRARFNYGKNWTLEVVEDDEAGA